MLSAGGRRLSPRCILSPSLLVPTDRRLFYLPRRLVSILHPFPSSRFPFPPHSLHDGSLCHRFGRPPLPCHLFTYRLVAACTHLSSPVRKSVIAPRRCAALCTLRGQRLHVTPGSTYARRAEHGRAGGAGAAGRRRTCQAPMTHACTVLSSNQIGQPPPPLPLYDRPLTVQPRAPLYSSLLLTVFGEKQII